MPRHESPANVPGTITLTKLPDGRYRAKARMRLQDRTRTDPDTGAYLPGPRIDLTATVTNPADAEAAIAAAAKVRIAKARNADAAIVRARNADKAMTVTEAATSVLDALRGTTEVTPSSLYVYELHVRRHLAASTLGTMQVAKVQPIDVRGYLAAVAADTGVATAKAGRAVLHRVFRWAVDAGLRTDDPSVGVRILTPRKTEPKGKGLDHDRALTKAERVALAWSVARDERARELDVRDLVLAGLAIGGRIGEMAAIRACDIQFAPDGRARVTLCGTVDWVKGQGLQRRPPKTASSVRTLPVPRRIAALLRRRLRAAGIDLEALDGNETPVFPAPGRWGQGQGWRDRSNTASALREVFDRAGFPDISFHTLRRSAVTALADVLPVRVAADYAGHASVRTTLDHYVGRSAVADAVADHL